MTMDLDSLFGKPRGPEKVDPWERGRKPASLCSLQEAAPVLRTLADISTSALCAAALRAKNFLWIMDQSGEILVAVEELAPHIEGTPYVGFPRRRAFTHPAEERKLGHPTLINGGQARIAGELSFDVTGDGSSLQLVLNANSGRYCRQKPPTPEQLARVREAFQAQGVYVTLDPD